MSVVNILGTRARQKTYISRYILIMSTPRQTKDVKSKNHAIRTVAHTGSIMGATGISSALVLKTVIMLSAVQYSGKECYGEKEIIYLGPF